MAEIEDPTFLINGRNAVFNIVKEDIPENFTLDDYIKTITSDNLAGNKKAISDTISQQCKNKIQLMKNWIQKCWDSSAKEFKKADGISDDGTSP